MAVVTLSQPGEDVTVGGSDVRVIGTSAGGEVITVVSGNIRFDPSFNKGGDTIKLPGDASDYTAYRSGGEVIMTSNDGLVSIRVPVGPAGMEIEFDNGDSRTLALDTSTNPPVAFLEGQAISTDPTSPTAISSSGPPPVVGYDVVGSNVSVTEGDSGQKALTFTITLDREVTAADGPVSLNYVTADGTASSSSDYVAAAGQVTFAVGQKVATVTVFVNGDTVPEGDETLQLQLTGSALRNGPETLIGTITNDDVAVGLTKNADNLSGSSGNDAWFAANTDLGAGDKISDPSTTDNDTLSLFVDATTANRNFGGFTLNNVENVEVTNDSGAAVSLDMSSSTGVKSVASVNSSDTVTFRQLTSKADVVVDNVTGASANVEAYYQASVTKGDTAINVRVDDATAGTIVLGTEGAGNTGIETVNMTVVGDSDITRLDTDLTNLNIAGTGSVAIDQALNSSVRSIDATGVAGDLDIDFSNNNGAGEGVTFKGAQGDNRVETGTAADNITTYGGNDTVFARGADVVRTNGGNDSVSVSGANAAVDINTGTGSDRVNFVNAIFDSSDKVALGGEAGDVLLLNQSSNEVDYTNVTGATTLRVGLQATTNLGNNGGGSLGQAAGIKTVDLNVNGNNGGDDTLIATDYTTGLTVNLGAVAGADTVLLGSGDDIINTASFDGVDNLSGGKGNDTLNVTDGATGVNGGNFRGIERINYLSDGDGDDHSLTLTDNNAPTGNGLLTIDGSSLESDEGMVIDVRQVSQFSVDVTTGAGNDTVFANNAVADKITTGAGNDYVAAGGGDHVLTGRGADLVVIVDGDNKVETGSEADYVVVVGAGNDDIKLGDGDDRVYFVASANLTKDDLVDGGNGEDDLMLNGDYLDGQLAGVSNFDIIDFVFATNSTIGVEAQEAGIRTVNLDAYGTSGTDILDASDYTVGLTVTSRNGDDVITTGSGADLVVAGSGVNTIATGKGDDRIRFSGSQLDSLDAVIGGEGNDTIELDNTLAEVNAVVDLDKVEVENFKILADGDRGAGVDADSNTLVFSSSSKADVVTSVTPINIDASALTDADDEFTFVIDGSVRDDDFAFNVTGSSTATTVEKQNLNIDNNLNFTGGSGVDTLKIDGGDAGSTVTFNGNGGEDRLHQTGGLLTDDGFVNMTSVEVLTGNTGGINAVLGSEAAQAGIVTVDGTDGQDRVTLGVGFTNALRVNLEAGDDIINGGASAAAVTFAAAAANFTAADILTGGTGTGDVVELTSGGTANLNGVTRVETISLVNGSLGADSTTIDLDWLAAEVDGTMLTINGQALSSVDSLTVNGGTVTENVTFNGGASADTVTTGSGADLINSGAGADVIASGSGKDEINAGAGADTVRGQAGDDLIEGEAGDDVLYGDFAIGDFIDVGSYNAAGGGRDTINGGIGNDTIIGGLGGDTLTGGADADVFLYQTRDDSRVMAGGLDNRDTIKDFTSGVDVIDLTGLPEAVGQTIQFNGNWNTFGEGQGAISGTAGDNKLDVVFVRETNTLWVDVDDNGVLNGEDMQIILEGVANLTAADVQNPHLVTGPEGFAPSSDAPMMMDASFVAPDYSGIESRGISEFASLHFV